MGPHKVFEGMVRIPLGSKTQKVVAVRIQMLPGDEDTSHLMVEQLVDGEMVPVDGDDRVDLIEAALYEKSKHSIVPEPDAMNWLLQPTRTKPLEEIRLADVPRGLSPEDIALDLPKFASWMLRWMLVDPEGKVWREPEDSAPNELRAEALAYKKLSGKERRLLIREAAQKLDPTEKVRLLSLIDSYGAKRESWGF